MLTESFTQVRCSDGFESYGRRRREANASVLEELVSVDTEHSNQLVTVLPSEVETSVTAVLDEMTSPETILDSTSFDPTAATAETTLIPPNPKDMDPTDMDPTDMDPTDMDPTDMATNLTITTTTTTSTTTTEATKTPEPRRKVNQYIPVEVPLHLQLIVAPEADRIAILPPPIASTNREYELQEMANRRRPSWRSPSFTQQYQDRTVEESTECSPKSSLVAVLVVAVILQVATLIAFYFFYRTKRSSWSKWSDSGKASSTDSVYGIRHSGSVSEVVSLSFLISSVR